MLDPLYKRVFLFPVRLRGWLEPRFELLRTITLPYGEKACLNAKTTGGKQKPKIQTDS